MSLVIGGTGFIGSLLCKTLLEQNKHVICMDNNSSGNINNVLSLFEKEGFTYIEKDIVKPFSAGELINLKKLYILEIYHLACPASPRAYQKDPIKTLETNFIGTQNVLKLAAILRAKVLYTSTSEIYGDPKVVPQPETYWGNVNTLGPRSCYDEGKRIGETLCYEYNKRLGVPIKIVRIFNTYGPNMKKDDGRVVSNFINQCLESKDITIYGDGSQTRSFCYVEDTINGLIKMMNHNSSYVGPINIGNPNEMTIKSLALLIRKLTNSKSIITFHNLPKDDPTRRKPDISKAKGILNWEPNINLEDGLNKTIKYFKELSKNQ
jgi:UDP-glucuronate decarboxylase